MVYKDPVTKNRYVFVTNNTTRVAKTIADIYKSRWQIELFFKWIKQHLKVKRFVGRSKNAVLTQLWVAMYMYLLLAYHQVRHASELEPSPNAAGAPAQRVRTSPTPGSLHDAVAGRVLLALPPPTVAEVGLKIAKMWNTSEGV